MGLTIFLAHLGASEKKRTEQVMTSTNGLLTVTHALTNTRSVNYALRSQFSKKQDTAFTDLTVPEFSMDLERTVNRESPITEEGDDDHGVEVRVERTIHVSRPPKVRYELEDYSRGGNSARRSQF